ncbi:uncharacterized protein LOC109610377 [Camponotus floridanus]|uniref:uncharacterized protein LOC109610377 n=1 Tax=Camponotus floridanus TaxID=104421 RepID=UPI000DC6A591|nr:uncharacterized protein LOC109610377 [Camponotus floridanus]
MVLHFEASFFIGEIATIAIGSMLIAYLKHTCGMFKIASYRIEKAMSMQNVCPKNEIIMYEGIIHAIDIHRTAIKFLTFSFTCMKFSLLSLITVAVICLSLNLYAIQCSMVCSTFAHTEIDTVSFAKR